MLDDNLEQAAQLIANSRKLVVFTGAGISTESGLPDYRGPDGVWTRRDKGLPPPKMTRPWSAVEPNVAHMAIVEFQKMGILDFLISQNVDNLHLKSGIQLNMIAELHGNTELMRCLECDARMSFKEAGWDKRIWGNGYRTDPIRRGQPKCPRCGGRIINSIVNFGDSLPERELKEAMKHSANCDVFLVIGSSLVVTPAANMPQIALENGAKLIILNQGKTHFDPLADIRLWGKAGETMTKILERVKAILKESDPR
ncbi:MAG: SIR2 family NAD-dependent protein deacylase [Candidatus Helarchaeota archaeon]